MRAHLGALVLMSASCAFQQPEDCEWEAHCRESTLVTRNACTGDEHYMRDCTPLACNEGRCEPPSVSPHLAAELSLGNMPHAFDVVRFPRIVLHSDEIPADGCRSTLVDTSNAPPIWIRMERAAQVAIEGPSGETQVVPESRTDQDYPYYLSVTPPEWDPAKAAGQTFTWHVIGLGMVPTFSLSITAPDPIDNFAPLPKGRSFVDFARADPPEFRWNETIVVGARLLILVGGLDVGQEKQRVLECNANDDGEFALPSEDLMRFAPGQLSLTLTRHITLRPRIEGFAGAVRATAFSGFLPLDSEGAAVPLIYTVN